MEPWSLDPEATLRPFTAADGPSVLQLIVANRTHLDRWLRWSSGIQTLDDALRFIAESQVRLSRNDGFHLGIWVGDRLAGGLVCWYIHAQNRNAEIGYWLGESFLGRGLATRAARRAIEHLFHDRDVHRIEMQCAVENTRSRAVPERLGFRLEGVRRESHWITSRFLDHTVYGLLESESKGSSDPT